MQHPYLEPPAASAPAYDEIAQPKWQPPAFVSYLPNNMHGATAYLRQVQKCHPTLNAVGWDEEAKRAWSLSKAAFTTDNAIAMMREVEKRMHAVVLAEFAKMPNRTEDMNTLFACGDLCTRAQLLKK